MIKICSLDFINKTTFEADVLTADGSVLVKSGELITPELLLRLYYFDIYVEQPISEDIAISTVESSVADATVFAGITSVSESVSSETVDSGAVSADAVSELLIDEVLPQASNSEVTFEESSQELVAASAAATAAAEAARTLDSATTGPRSGDVSGLGSSAMDENLTKGPRFVDVASNTVEKDENVKGPRLAEPVLIDTDTKVPDSSKSIVSNVQPEKIEIPEEDPLDKQLEFDEVEAKRIVQASIKMGKMLNYSANDLKELEQVAYYCNIGISKFKKRDMFKKNFRKMKFLASYEKITREGLVSDDIAELVKYCINPYDTETFQLNSKIPYHHIVSITSFYEDLLAQNNSKQNTLEKMLQLGGNHFNVFILHKFINMMRGFDE